MALVRPLILGIDPGIRGGIALFDHTLKMPIMVWDVPVIKRASNEKNWVDIPAFAELLKPFANEVLFAVIEEPTAMPNDGPVQAFRFGHACGIAEGIVAGFRIPTHRVRPAVWKTMMGLSPDKNLSRKRVMERFPKHADFFKRIRDDGRAEALLLALFGEKHFLIHSVPRKAGNIADLF